VADQPADTGRSPRYPMHDRPTAAELLSAVRHFLETELLPTLSDARLRFQMLVAANVLAVAEREVEVEDQHLREEWEWLSGLLLLTQPGPDATAELRRAVRAANVQLCSEIRKGHFDEPGEFLSLLRELRKGVVRKLEVANPRYLASLSELRVETPPTGHPN
jgi:hypothetical protein